MSATRFGVMLPVGTKGELSSDHNGASGHWQIVRSTALAAEELGFDSVHVPDHLHNTPVAANRTLFECWTTLAALAEATKTIRLSQSVTNAAFRNPALLAKITSSVDIISNGRLDWVVGAGWFEPEYHSYGYHFGTPGERLALRKRFRSSRCCGPSDHLTSVASTSLSLAHNAIPSQSSVHIRPCRLAVTARG